MTNPINYDPNTPTTKLSYADWQIQFIQNFTQLNNAFSQNHIALDATTNAGNHTYVEMPEQSENSKPQTGAVEFTIYTKNVEDQTDQVFFVYPGNTPVVQFTNYQIYSVKPSTGTTGKSPQTSYFTFLPGGILIYFGSFGPFENSSAGRGSGANTLFLYPPVAKNIVSFNLCGKGIVPIRIPGAFPGAIQYDPSKGGIFVTDVINEFSVNLEPNVTLGSVYYFVVANI